MFVPFCSVQRKSTGSVLPGLGCIFKTTRQPLRNGLRKTKLSTMAGVGAAIGDGLPAARAGNGFQFRPHKIHDELPRVLEMRVQADAHGDDAVFGKFQIRRAALPAKPVAEAAGFQRCGFFLRVPKRDDVVQPLVAVLNSTRCKSPSPQLPCGSTQTLGTCW